jgi:hypothetical protein
MRQHPDPDDYEDEDLEESGTPVYQGTGLSVRALTAEELQRFLDAHAGEPAELLGRGWSALDPPGDPSGVPRTPPAAALRVVPAEVTGSPGRSALAAYRRRRARELAAWTRSLAWRAPLVAAAGLAGQVLATEAGLPRAGLVGWPWLRWSAGGCGSGPPSRPAPGSAAPPGSGTPPACFAASTGTATWCSTTLQCPGIPARTWIIW